MAKIARTSRPGMTFVTFPTYKRRPIFEVARTAELFIDTLLHYRTLGHYKLHAYVVLPSQVHLLLTPQSMSLDQTLELIKYGFSHRLSAEFPVWDRSFSLHPIGNIRDLEVVRAFLHQLPVRARLSPSPELYPHSSAYRTSSGMPTLSGASI